MTFRFGYTEAAILVGVLLLTLAMLVLPRYDRPPLVDVQNGYRGTGMAQIYNPREVEVSAAENALPELQLPPLVTTGPTAAESYQNVQVLGDLSTAQFLRLMTAITAWVSPEQGCAYCHEGEGFANDDVYTKRVSRWMIHMVRDLNNNWANHVLGAWDGEAEGAGVNCWTCHRGNNVPEYVWYEDADVVSGLGLVGYRAGQNRASPEVGLASLPEDPFSYHLMEETPQTLGISVNSDIALPMANRASIKQTEMTYALMMHMSTSLGVNCTYCHNTRNWSSWDQSTPQRTSAWYGIQLAQALNTDYIIPSTPALPPHRLGPRGDASKVNCTTCHQNVYKPLYGANMIEDFPGLTYANYVDRETLEPGLADAETSMEIGRQILEANLHQQSEAAQPAPEEATAAPDTPTEAVLTQEDGEAATEEVTDPVAGEPTAEQPAATPATPQPVEPQLAEPEAPAPATEATAEDEANVTVTTPEEGEADVTIVEPGEDEAEAADAETEGTETDDAPAPADTETEAEATQ